MAIVLQMGHLNSGWLASLNAILEQFTALYSGVDALENGVINGGFWAATNELIARINVVLTDESLATLPELTNSDFTNGANFLLSKIATNLATIVGATLLAPVSVLFPQGVAVAGTIEAEEQAVVGDPIIIRVTLPTDSVDEDTIVVAITSSTVGTISVTDLDITPEDITAGYVDLLAEQVGTGDGTTVVGTVRLKRGGVLSATTGFTVIIENV